jgi:hypothetical protein
LLKIGFGVERSTQWLKRVLKKCLAKEKAYPSGKQNTFGTAEAVPLSKTDFFSTL